MMPQEMAAIFVGVSASPKGKKMKKQANARNKSHGAGKKNGEKCKEIKKRNKSRSSLDIGKTSIAATG